MSFIMEPSSAAPQPEQVEEKGESFWKELIKFTLIAVLIVVPIRTFIAQPFIVSGASMDPTFWDGEYLIVDEISYRFQEPQRGEVIIFRYPEDPSKFFIKRVIGLPEETVTIFGDTVKVKTVSGEEFELEEPYIEESRRSNYDNITITLEKDQFYVLGDNRIGSSDSRRWGPLPRENIVGRPFARLLPPSQIALFPGRHTYNDASLTRASSTPLNHATSSAQ